jgi:hypothetical protein
MAERYKHAIAKLEPHPLDPGGYIGEIKGMRVELLPFRDQAGEHGMIVLQVTDSLERPAD